jgi:hypothetical protein
LTITFRHASMDSRLPSRNEKPLNDHEKNRGLSRVANPNLGRVTRPVVPCPLQSAGTRCAASLTQAKLRAYWARSHRRNRASRRSSRRALGADRLDLVERGLQHAAESGEILADPLLGDVVDRLPPRTRRSGPATRERKPLTTPFACPDPDRHSVRGCRPSTTTSRARV